MTKEKLNGFNAVTPAQARTMSCPFARAPVVVPDSNGNLAGAVAANRIANDGSPDRDTLCLGPVCMMWRWHTYNHGYCGVAGKPLPMEDIRNDHD